MSFFVLVLLLFVTAFSVTIFRKTYFLSPGKLFTIIWLFQLWLMILCFSNVIILKNAGIIYIIMAVIFFTVGTQLINPTVRNSYLINCRPTKQLDIITLLLFCLSMINPLDALLKKGFTLGMLISLQSLFEVNNAISVERYIGNESTRLFSQISLVFTYLGPLCGGFFCKFIKKYISYLTIFPGIFTALTQGVKMGLITSVMLWITGFFVMSLMTNQRIRMSASFLIKIGITGCVFFMLLISSMILRIGKFDSNVAEDLQDRLAVYSLGHIPAFCSWFDNYDNDINNFSLGAQTFYGISNQLGIKERKQGVFAEFPQVTKRGGHSNVFSIFRITIEDFGILGSLVWLLGIGLISKLFYVDLLNGNNIYFSATMLAMTYFMMFWSFVTSAIAYTSYIVMFILFYLIIRMTIKIRKTLSD